MVPVQYLKQIQTGEFFDISKLLPKNMSLVNNHHEVVYDPDSRKLGDQG